VRVPDQAHFHPTLVREPFHREQRHSNALKILRCSTQATLLGNEITLISVAGGRTAAALLLIEALGGDGTSQACHQPGS
jgi:hypothetical protein